VLTSVGRDRIGVLRAVAGASDTLAHRRALERAIGPASLRPHGLAPQAIVCVRRLRMSAEAAGGRAFAARLESHVEHVVSRAVHPFTEMVPANADAVLFRDESEMLACLVRDWRVGNAWWWKGLLGRDADEALVHQRLLEAPALFPSMVARFADRGEAHDVVRSMPVHTCAALIEGVTRAFALPRALPVSAYGDAAREAEWPREPVQTGARRSLHTLHTVLVDTGVIGAVTTMPDESRLLLTLCLVIVRAPALARTEPVAPLVARWVAWNRSRQGTSFVPSAMATTAAPGEARALPRVMLASKRERTRDEKHGSSATDGARAPSDEQRWQRVDDLPIPHDTFVAPGAGRALRVTSPTAVENVTTTPKPDLTPFALSSDYAGVFYLVNVLLHMELYADFTNPERASLPLPLGDLLALIGARVSGDAFRRDVIWRVLADVAGREPRQPPRRTLRTGIVRRRDVRAFNRWFASLRTRMEARLALALAMPAAQTLSHVCGHRGTLTLTDTRLDVCFPLEEHPLGIRLAGLDRDPGWVPALGRIITYHYD
jgi:hypothetical protein